MGADGDADSAVTCRRWRCRSSPSAMAAAGVRRDVMAAARSLSAAASANPRHPSRASRSLPRQALTIARRRGVAPSPVAAEAVIDALKVVEIGGRNSCRCRGLVRWAPE